MELRAARATPLPPPHAAPPREAQLHEGPARLLEPATSDECPFLDRRAFVLFFLLLLERRAPFKEHDVAGEAHSRSGREGLLPAQGASKGIVRRPRRPFHGR